MAIPRAFLPLAAALALTGCFTGERPSFDDDDRVRPAPATPTSTPCCERLDAVPIARFTAEYDVTTRFGDIESEAVVVQSDDGRRSITINDVRFVIGDGTDSTCDLAADECEASINDARVSDVGVTHEFYGASFAARLRVDANRRVADTPGTPQAWPGSRPRASTSRCRASRSRTARSTRARSPATRATTC